MGLSMDTRRGGGAELGKLRVGGEEGGKGENRRTPKITGHKPNNGPPRNFGSIIRATDFSKQRSPWNAAHPGAFGAEVH